VKTVKRVICRRFIVAPETKIIPCGPNAVKTEKGGVSRAREVLKGRMRGGEKKLGRKGLTFFHISAIIEI